MTTTAETNEAEAAAAAAAAAATVVAKEFRIGKPGTQTTPQRGCNLAVTIKYHSFKFVDLIVIR